MKQADFLPTRHSLILRLKNWQDQESWQDFFDTYWKLIYGVARKAGLSDTEAQDVVQETVMTVAKKIGAFQVGAARGSFKSWLLTTTRWRIADQFRKRAPHLESSHRPTDETARTSDIERVPDQASLDLEEAWEHEWEQNLFDAALKRVKCAVNAATYQMFQLHVLKEWPAAKVAETVGARLQQVYFAKYKVSRLIKKELKRLKKELV